MSSCLMLNKTEGREFEVKEKKKLSCESKLSVSETSHNFKSKCVGSSGTESGLTGRGKWQGVGKTTETNDVQYGSSFLTYCSKK